MKISVCNENVNDIIDFNDESPDYIIDFSHINKNGYYLEFSGIYFIVNLYNNKIYIGSTKNIRERINKHILKLQKLTHHSPKLLNALNKYGFNIFKIKVYKLLYDRETLFDIEEYLIKLFRTCENGYNMVECSRSCNNEGERNGMSRLKIEDVIYIRSNYLNYSLEELCQLFNISMSYIRLLLHLKKWNYPNCIPEDYREPRTLATGRINDEDILFIRNNVYNYTMQLFCNMFETDRHVIGNIIHLRTYNHPELIPEGYVEPVSAIGNNQLTNTLVLFIRNNINKYYVEDFAEMFNRRVDTIKNIIKLRCYTHSGSIPDGYIPPDFHNCRPKNK